MSSFDIAVVAVELDRLLRGLRVNNIYQLNPKILLLKLRGRGSSYTYVIIEAGKRIHTTSYGFETPLKPPDFCMALRKYLRNGLVENVCQYRFERIIEIKIRSRGEEYRLIIELFGEGNVILVDPKGRILHAMSYRRMRDRNIIRGEVFIYPPRRGMDPRGLRREDLGEIKRFGQLGVVRALARFLSIGGTYAEEVLLRAGVEKDVPCSSLSEEDLDSVFDSLREILSEHTYQNRRPCVFVDERGGWVDAAPAPLRTHAHLKHVRFETFNEALDEFYAKLSVEEKVSDVKGVVEREVARLQRILRSQEETLRESRRKAELYQRIGDTIYRHLNELQLLLQRVIGERRGGTSWDEIVETLQDEKRELRSPAVYFQSVNPRSLSLQVSVEGQTFDLGLKLSAQENAADYYARAKKAKRRIRGAERAIEQTKQKIEEAKRRVTVRVRETAKPPAKRRREWYEKFRWFLSSSGFLVIGGRDASTNEVLIKRYMKPQDMVFHAEVPGAPFVLVKTEGRTPPEETLREAAQFAASYSRAWREGLGAVNVYWVKPDQVSKGPPSGQFLPRGSFMIYGKKNYVKGVPLEVALGVKKEDAGVRVIGGPPEAIAEQTRVYVRLVPGRDPSSRLAKKIRCQLARMSPEEEKTEVLRVPLEEIQRFIPAGRGALR